MKTKEDGRVSVRVSTEFLARVQNAVSVANLDLPTVVRALLDAFADHVAVHREVAFPLTLVHKAELYRLRKLRSLMSQEEVQAILAREKEVNSVEVIEEVLLKSGVSLQDFEAAIRNALERGAVDSAATPKADAAQAAKKRPQKVADGKKAIRQ